MQAVIFTSAWLVYSTFILAQVPAPFIAQTAAGSPATPSRRPAPVSPQTANDGRVTFRVFAPQASTVTLGGDINQGLNSEPGPDRGASAASSTAAGIPMTKGADGIWSGTSILPMKP